MLSNERGLTFQYDTGIGSFFSFSHCLSPGQHELTNYLELSIESTH
jgi:hypothetical protein